MHSAVTTRDEDTIVSIVTGPSGQGAVSIIRLSGTTALQASRPKLCTPALDSDFLHSSWFIVMFMCWCAYAISTSALASINAARSILGTDATDRSCAASHATEFVTPLQVASKIFRPGGTFKLGWEPESHRVYYGTAVDLDGSLIDEVRRTRLQGDWITNGWLLMKM